MSSESEKVDDSRSIFERSCTDGVIDNINILEDGENDQSPLEHLEIPDSVSDLPTRSCTDGVIDNINILEDGENDQSPLEHLEIPDSVSHLPTRSCTDGVNDNINILEDGENNESPLEHLEVPDSISHLLTSPMGKLSSDPEEEDDNPSFIESPMEKSSSDSEEEDDNPSFFERLLRLAEDDSDSAGNEDLETETNNMCLCMIADDFNTMNGMRSETVGKKTFDLNCSREERSHITETLNRSSTAGVNNDMNIVEGGEHIKSPPKHHEISDSYVSSTRSCTDSVNNNMNIREDGEHNKSPPKQDEIPDSHVSSTGVEVWLPYPPAHVPSQHVLIGDNGEPSNDGPSETSGPNRIKWNKHSRQQYTLEERSNILKYIVNRQEYSQMKGRQMWLIMERRQVCPSRTWQSMKEHFLKKIIFDLDSYDFLSDEDKRKIRRAYF